MESQKQYQRCFSFEFFPPKSLEGSFRLWDCVNVLGPLAWTAMLLFGVL